MHHGTNGYFDIEIDPTGSEVSIFYNIDIKIQNKPVNLKFYTDENHTIELPVENGIININDIILLEEVNEIRNIRIYWDWAYETGNTQDEISQNDELDKVSAGDIIIISVNVTGTQVEPGSVQAEYTVHYYLENANNNNFSYYSTEHHTMIANKLVTLSNLGREIENANYGFGRLTENGEVISNAEIKEDGSTVIYMYYYRNRYPLEIVAGENISKVKSIGTSETAEQETNMSRVTKYKWGEEVTISTIIKDLEGKYGVFDGWDKNLPISLGANYNHNFRETVIIMPNVPLQMKAKAIYTDAPDTVLPVWTYSSKTNSNAEYEEYANINHDISIVFNAIDDNYVANYLTVDKIKIYVGNEEIIPTVKTLSTEKSIENGVQYTLSLKGLSGNGDLKIKILDNTIQDKSENFSAETILETGIIIDNIAPNSPEIMVSDSGGYYSEDYNYSDYITYKITAGKDTLPNTASLINDNTKYAQEYNFNMLDAVGAIFMPASYAETVTPISTTTDSIAKTYYKVSGAVTIDESLYASDVKIELQGARGECIISAITYDKAGNASVYTTKIGKICGLHDKDSSHQEVAATCTAAEVLSYRCSACFKADGTYSGSAAKGHNYPCSGSNHKRSGGSVSIKCSRCTTTKSYSVTNGSCTYWSCSCGKSGGYSSHSYKCSGSNHKRSGGSVTVKCSRCSSSSKTYSVTNGTCTYWKCSCGATGGVNSHSYTYSCSRKGGTVYSCLCSRCNYCGNCQAKH